MCERAERVVREREREREEVEREGRGKSGEENGKRKAIRQTFQAWPY